ncbi:MAG: hypothetical protein JWM82_80 [Myxococcales bacterium]|nr:hypothetical protein [Myxococcales bacterium]
MNLRLAGALALSLTGLACGGRPAFWSDAPSGAEAFGLSNAVALHDRAAQRVVTLGVGADGGLTKTSFPTGKDVVATAVDANGTRLFLLSAGHRGGLGDTQPDEAPRLTIVDGSAATPASRVVDLGDVLSDPLDGLTIDPTGQWAVLYARGAQGAFVTNPNELVVVGLALDAAKPVPVTLHSFGGRPEKLVFTPELSLPGQAGKSHLLVVQSAQDLSLVSLDHPERPEITVRLADADAASAPRPAEIVVDDGDPAKTDDARIGIRFENDTSVMTLQLTPAPGPNGFAPVPNVTDVGGVPSALAFVRTDGGLRLAALVPDRVRAVLVDPVTTITSEVALPTAYHSVSLVTAATSTTAAGVDVALLWNGSAGQAGVAFWELGQAAGRPFRSLETVAVADTVTGVLDVSGPNATSKVLSTAQGSVFYVLDLAQRTATPLLTARPGVALFVSPTGARVWTFEKGGTALAATDLATKHVRTLHLDEPASAVFEIAGGAGRTLVVLHDFGGVGATLLDANDPNDNQRRLYGALLTEVP